MRREVISTYSTEKGHIHPRLHSYTVDNPQGCSTILHDQIHFIPIIKTDSLVFGVQETFTIC